MIISAEVAPNYPYQWQSTTNLTPPIQWVNWGSVVTASSTTLELQTVPQGNGNNRFFRVIPSQLTVSKNMSPSTFRMVAAGSQGVEVNSIRFRASHKDVDLYSLGLKLGFPNESSSGDVVEITVWDGATLVGRGFLIGSNTSTTIVFDTMVHIPKDTDKVLSVKVDLMQIGVSHPTSVSGHRVALSYDDTNPSATLGVDVESGQNIEAIGSAESPGVRVMKSIPTISLDTIPTSGASDGIFIRFKITADPAGSVSFRKFSPWVNPMGATVANVNLFGYTDPSYSNPILSVGAGGQISATNFSQSSIPSLEIYAQKSDGSPGTVEIPAGQTYYFELRGMTWSTNSTFDIATILPRDGYATSMTTTAGVEEMHAAAFIWSPNTRTSSSLDDLDWTNSDELHHLPLPVVIRSK